MKQRQSLDRVFTFKTAGTTYRTYATPTQYANDAVMRYVREETGRVDASQPYVFRNGSASSEDAVTLAEAVTFALSELVRILRQRSPLTDMLAVFSGRALSDLVARDRNFGGTLYNVRAALELPGAVRKGGRGVPASFAGVPLALREAYAALFIAAMCAHGVVEWPANHAASRAYESILVRTVDLPLLAAEGHIWLSASMPQSMGKLTRENTNTVEKSVERILHEYAKHLADASQIGYSCGRLTEIATYAARGGHANLPMAKLAPFLSAVNFISAGPAVGTSNYVDAAIAGQDMADVLKALGGHPDVAERTLRDYAAMFSVKHHIVTRGDRIVLTRVERNYPKSEAPSRAFDTSPEPTFGMTLVSPASDHLKIGRLDELLSVLMQCFGRGLNDALAGTLTEGEAIRAVLSAATPDELRVLAACLAGEIEFHAKDADPGSDLTATYILRPYSKISGWDDLATDALAGSVAVPRAMDVFRMVAPYEGDGTYAVGDGLSDLLGTGNNAMLPIEQGGNWLSGTKPYTVPVSYPLYTYDAATGVKAENGATTDVEVTAFTSIDVAPVSTYVVTMSPTLRARFRDAAAETYFLWSLVHGVLLDASELGLVFDLHELQRGPFGEDWAGVKAPGAGYDASNDLVDRRDAAAASAELFVEGSIVRLVTSEPMRRVHSHLLRRAGAKSHNGMSDVEADAFVATVFAFLKNYLLAVLGKGGNAAGGVITDAQSDDRLHAVLRFNIKNGATNVR